MSFDTLDFKFIRLTQIFLVIVLISTQASSQTSTSKEDTIAKIMEFFYIQHKVRSPYDRITISGSTANLKIWKELPPEPDPAKVECSGYQWLLGGRGKKMGLGASEVFRQVPDIQKINLEFVDVEFDEKGKGKTGRLEMTHKEKSYLLMSVSKNQVANAHSKNLKNALNKSLADCLKIGRSIVREKEIKL